MLFSLDIGIDLGTANTLVFVKGKGIVIREPSVVAVDQKYNPPRVVAVGTEAKEMIGRTPGSITAVRPLKDGVIADFDITADMLKAFIKKVTKNSPLARVRVMICIPSGVTGVERNAVNDAARSAGAKYVSLIEEPMAAAIGAGLPVSEPTGSMVVDIGGGTTDIAVLSLNGIATSSSIKVAGDTFDEAVAAYMRKRYGMLIGLNTAEEVKITIGCVYERPQEVSMLVKGRDAKTGLPNEVAVSSMEMLEAFKRPARQIVDEVLDVLEHSSPELVADIAQNGIVLTGGSARLKDIDELFRRVTGMDVRIASAETGISEDSREAVANPAFATVVGMLLKGAGMGSCNVIEDKAGLSPRRPVPPTSVPGFQPPQPQSRPQPQPYAPTRPSTETVNAAYARREAARAESAAVEPEAEDAGEDPAPQAPVQEPVKKERNWRSIFKRTLDKINEGFNAADDEEI